MSSHATSILRQPAYDFKRLLSKHQRQTTLIGVKDSSFITTAKKNNDVKL